MKKKILSIVLTLAMLLSAASVLTTTAIAAEAPADVTSGDIVIATYEDLKTFLGNLAGENAADYQTKTVVVVPANGTKVITGPATGTATSDAGLTAADADKLVTAATTFKGKFYGNGVTFENIYIKGESLFGTLDGATVTNLTLKNCYLTAERTGDPNAQAYGSFIAGTASGNTSISYVKINGCKASDYWSVFGGVVGVANANSNVEIDNCKNLDGAVYMLGNSKSGLLGGMVGQFEGTKLTISNCENSSTLVSTNSNATVATNNFGGAKVGGMVSVTSEGTVEIKNCVNRGNIQALSIAGGMVSDNRTTLKITDCLNTGTVSAGISGKNVGKYAGGFVGQGYNGSSKITISGSANTGSVTANFSGNDNAMAGGAIGTVGGSSHPAVTVNDFLNTGDISAYYAAGGVVGKYPLTSGTFERIISFGKVRGYNKTTTAAPMYSCALIGLWEAYNANTDVYVTVTDFYFSYYEYDNYDTYKFNSEDNRNASANNTHVFGINKELGSKYGNYVATYTKDDPDTTLTFIGGTNNALTEGQASAGTEAKNQAAYDKFFCTHARVNDLTTVFGVGHEIKDTGYQTAKKFQAFDLGTKWVITNGAPMPIGASKLLNKRATGDKAINYIGLQTKIKDTSISEIRFIAETNGANLENYSKVGFKINYIESGDSPTYVRLESECENGYVYSELNAYAEDGTKLDPIKSQKEGYCLTAVTVSGLNDSKNSTYKAGTYTFTITPYLVDLNGAKVEGESFAIVLTRATDGGACTLVYAYAM